MKVVLMAVLVALLLCVCSTVVADEGSISIAPGVWEEEPVELRHMPPAPVWDWHMWHWSPILGWWRGIILPMWQGKGW